MNELAILDYIIKRLADVDNENDVANVMTELKTARKAIAVVPCYGKDDMIAALFGGEESEVNADA